PERVLPASSDSARRGPGVDHGKIGQQGSSVQTSSKATSAGAQQEPCGARFDACDCTENGQQRLVHQRV
ncbi:MAG: hypothetical protein ACK55Z_31745, partial [bacterium]